MRVTPFLAVAVLAACTQIRADDWQAEAVKKFPDLAKAGTPLNLKFRELVAERRAKNPEFYKLPTWPLVLANEAALQLEREKRNAPVPKAAEMPPTPQPAQAATAPAQPLEKRAEEPPAPPKTPFAQLLEKYGATKTDAIHEKQFEKGKFYFIGGGAGQVFYIAQVTDAFILAANVRKEPWAVLTFEDPEALETIQIPQKGYAVAVGRFERFQSIEMTTGAARRFPVFVCTGIDVVGSGFVNTEKKP